MTDRELADAFAELRTLCMDIMGFHWTCEHAEKNRLTEADRLMMQSLVYAGGYDLAKRVCIISEALNDRA